jgi:hypothetical protein
MKDMENTLMQRERMGSQRKFNFINYERVAQCVKGYNDFVAKYGLDLDEEKYILDIALDARLGKIQQMKSSDMMGNLMGKLNVGQLIKKVTKAQEESEE